MLLLTLAYVPSVGAAQLSDIAGNPFEKQITKLIDAGVINGFPDGTFKPDQEVTRAQFAKLVAVAFALPTTGVTTSTFSDVAADHWAIGFIEAAVAKGWIKGYPDGTFGPEREHHPRRDGGPDGPRHRARTKKAPSTQEALSFRATTIT